jgi:hypothetical protein
MTTLWTTSPAVALKTSGNVAVCPTRGGDGEGA